MHVSVVRPLLTLMTLVTLMAGAVTSAAALTLNAPRPLEAYAENTLFSAFGGRSPRTLDPQRSYSSDETVYTYNIYEPLYGYHYLKRPYTLIPRTALEVAEPVYLDKDGHELPADADPAVIAESRYDIRLRPGIRFAPHPAFARDVHGAYRYHNLPEAEARTKHSPADFAFTGTRELTAADYVYGIRRLASPEVMSPVLGTLSAYIIGLRELSEAYIAKRKAAPDKPLDLLSVPFTGAEALDDYTLRLHVRGKYPQFSNWLTMTFFAPVPWEADVFYRQPALRDNNFTLDTWPVGTGPFMMTVFEENRRHEMRRNPDFRLETYPCEGEPGDREHGWLEGCGKPLPLLDRAVFDIEKEGVPLQTKFLQGYYDSPAVDRTDTGLGFIAAMADSAEKAALYREKALQLPETVEASIFYLGFNWLDPVVGGSSKRARLLRQALSIAVDWEEYLAIFQKNQGVAAQGPLPPGLFGWRDDGPSAFNPVVYKKAADGTTVRRPIEEARALLAEAGYPDGRDAKTGAPLILSFDYQSAAQGAKSVLEWYQKQFAKLGIQLDIRATDYNRFQDKMARGAAQIFLWGWVADYPDAENFLFLFYGPGGKALHGGENACNYENPAFDRAFEAMKYLNNGPEKQRLIDEMITLMQQDAVIQFGYFPKAAAAYQSWVTNAKPSGMIRNSLMYMGVEPEKRLQRIREWNEPVLWPLALLLAGLAALFAAARRLKIERDNRRMTDRTPEAAPPQEDDR